MNYRETVWTHEDGCAWQVSLMLLDEHMEPLCEFTLPVGPFHPLDEQRSVLRDDVRRWLRQVGVQLELRSS